MAKAQINFGEVGGGGTLDVQTAKGSTTATFTAVVGKQYVVNVTEQSRQTTPSMTGTTDWQSLETMDYGSTTRTHVGTFTASATTVSFTNVHNSLGVTTLVSVD